MTPQSVKTDDLELLFDLLPSYVRESLDSSRNNELLEIVMDLGRLPEARYAGGYAFLTSNPVTKEDISHVIRRIGEFGGDHRAGIERTLHRISAITNRKDDVVGLTCRVGRAIFGTIDPIRDVVDTGKSILFLGRPGVGKTTMLREVARVLSDEFNKRVMIVDTSNEIAGDGDIPHPAIGHSRRMQVKTPLRQAEVMIEAVENHMPEVIIIDEIGTEAESQAARTIAERGVQLIGTAHGNTLENLVLNPTLSDLIGGIHTVTLSDEEARRRGSQKTVLERKAPPTFDVVIEMRSKDELVIHHEVAAIIDGYLRGDLPTPEIRKRSEDGGMEVVQKAHVPEPRGIARMGDEEQADGGRGGWGRDRRSGWGRGGERFGDRRERPHQQDRGYAGDRAPAVGTRKGPVKVFPYGISRNYLERSIEVLKAPVIIVRDVAEANAIVTLKGQVKKLPARVKDAERHGARMFVLRSNTQVQMDALVEEMTGRGGGGASDEQVLTEAEQAAKRAMEGTEPVELPPASSYIRRLQHQLAERYGLKSTSIGLEPNRRVIMYRRLGE